MARVSRNETAGQARAVKLFVGSESYSRLPDRQQPDEHRHEAAVEDEAPKIALRF